eukprot:TRINITY_DN8039_c0_g1_i1.p1 TRINITY_DN8039_c0_g1~~TRINITY_DN8039_c0_g1_i1.p1  ORF type:complete len:556 (+),score=74.28 TRINITY_DN8039_c0_g1_i1:2-1669(+)
MSDVDWGGTASEFGDESDSQGTFESEDDEIDRPSETVSGAHLKAWPGRAVRGTVGGLMQGSTAKVVLRRRSPRATPPPCPPPPPRRKPDEVTTSREAAIHARDMTGLTAKWWESSRPRKRGKIPPKPAGSTKDFQRLFQEWLRRRGLTGALKAESDQHGYSVFRLVRNKLTPRQDQEWTQAFHGTRCYALWLIIASGVMLESNDKDAGHDFWQPGVYCTPLLSTARWYGRPHILFGDGVYHRVVLELRVDPSRRTKERQRGGVQWVFPEGAVVIRAIWVQSNAPPDAGEQRFDTWNPMLEAVPEGSARPEPVVNDCQDQWLDDDEGSFESLESEQEVGGHNEHRVEQHLKQRRKDATQSRVSVTSGSRIKPPDSEPSKPRRQRSQTRKAATQAGGLFTFGSRIKALDSEPPKQRSQPYRLRKEAKQGLGSVTSCSRVNRPDSEQRRQPDETKKEAKQGRGSATSGRQRLKPPDSEPPGSTATEQTPPDAAEKRARSLIVDIMKKLDLTQHCPLEQRKIVFRSLQKIFNPDNNLECQDSVHQAFQKLMERRERYLS